MKLVCQQPVLGILGGMGPMATVDFLGKLTRMTPADCDQQHVPWLTLSQPGMPDRSSAIRSGDDSPRAWLCSGVERLSAQGVSLIAVPCSTSHHWFDAMQAASSAPLVHIADAAAAALHDGAGRGTNREMARVAVLATRGTIASGMYATRLEAAGFEPFNPGEGQQTQVDGIIAAVKRGDTGAARRAMLLLEEELARDGVGTCILACTELPLARGGGEHALAAIDATEALARLCLQRLGYLD